MVRKKGDVGMIEGQGGDLASLRQELLSKQGGLMKRLTGGYTTSSQKKRGGLGELASLAAKRRSDAIKISTITLRDKLVSELDEAITDQLREYPEMKGRYFVGFVMDETPSVEVVDIVVGSKAVEGMNSEEAEKMLSDSPVGYFQPGDFTVKTPKDEAFHQFQERLTDYLSKNSKVIKYLQSHPEQVGTLDAFIKKV